MGDRPNQANDSSCPLTAIRSLKFGPRANVSVQTKSEMGIRKTTRREMPAANPQDIHNLKMRESACCNNDLLFTNSQGPRGDRSARRLGRCCDDRWPGGHEFARRCFCDDFLQHADS